MSHRQFETANIVTTPVVADCDRVQDFASVTKFTGNKFAFVRWLMSWNEATTGEERLFSDMLLTRHGTDRELRDLGRPAKDVAVRKTGTETWRLLECLVDFRSRVLCFIFGEVVLIMTTTSFMGLGYF